MRHFVMFAIVLLLFGTVNAGVFAEPDTITAKSVNEHGQAVIQNLMTACLPYAEEGEDGQKHVSIDALPQRLQLAYNEISCAAVALGICQKESVGDYCDQADAFLTRADKEIADFSKLKEGL